MKPNIYFYSEFKMKKKKSNFYIFILIFFPFSHSFWEFLIQSWLIEGNYTKKVGQWVLLSILNHIGAGEVRAWLAWKF